MQFRQSQYWANVVAGLCLTGVSRITPEAYMTWCRVVARARCLPFTGMVLCLFSSSSQQIILPVFEWIFADSSSQCSLPFRSFKPFLVSMGFRWVFFHWSGFSVTVAVGSCLQGWFLLMGLPWIPPCLGLNCSAPHQPLRYQFPSSFIGDEFKLQNFPSPVRAKKIPSFPFILDNAYPPPTSGNKPDKNKKRCKVILIRVSVPEI